MGFYAISKGLMQLLFKTLLFNYPWKIKIVAFQTDKLTGEYYEWPSLRRVLQVNKQLVRLSNDGILNDISHLEIVFQKFILAMLERII